MTEDQNIDENVVSFLTISIGDQIDAQLQECPYCHIQSNALTPVGKVYCQTAPKPGEISLCPSCGEICVFDDNLKFRIPSPEELEEIMTKYPILDTLRRVVTRMKQMGVEW